MGIDAPTTTGPELELELLELPQAASAAQAPTAANDTPSRLAQLIVILIPLLLMGPLHRSVRRRGRRWSEGGWSGGISRLPPRLEPSDESPRSSSSPGVHCGPVPGDRARGPACCRCG